MASKPNEPAAQVWLSEPNKERRAFGKLMKKHGLTKGVFSNPR